MLGYRCSCLMQSLVLKRGQIVGWSFWKQNGWWRSHCHKGLQPQPLSSLPVWLSWSKDALKLSILEWSVETEGAPKPPPSQSPPIGLWTNVVSRSLQISSHCEKQGRSMLIEWISSNSVACSQRQATLLLSSWEPYDDGPIVSILRMVQFSHSQALQAPPCADPHLSTPLAGLQQTSRGI